MRIPSSLHTLLAAALHRLLYVLRERGAVVTLEGQPPAPHPQRGAAGGGGGARARVGATSPLTPPPALHPGEGLGGLAVGGAALQSVVISDWLATARRLCGRSQQVKGTIHTKENIHRANKENKRKQDWPDLPSGWS